MSLSLAGATVIGSGISSGLNFISNAMNNNRQEGLTDVERKWRERMAARANQWSIEQWNRENAYNDPSAQMERLANAGINPALAYASGVFNQAASSPSVNTPDGLSNPKTMPYQLDPMMLSNLATASAQRELLDAQANEQNALADLHRDEMGYYPQLISESKQRIEESKSQIQVNNEEIKKKVAEVKVLDADEKLRIAQKGKIEFDKVMESKRYFLDKKEIEVRVKLYEKEGKAYEAAAARDLAKAALDRRELDLLNDTYQERVLGIKMQTQYSAQEVSEMQAKLNQLGISINYETGEITVEPGGYNEVVSSDFYQYGQAIMELLGTAFGFVVPIGRTSKAVKVNRVTGFGK